MLRLNRRLDTDTLRLLETLHADPDEGTGWRPTGDARGLEYTRDDGDAAGWLDSIIGHVLAGAGYVVHGTVELQDGTVITVTANKITVRAAPRVLH